MQFLFNELPSASLLHKNAKPEMEVNESVVLVAGCGEVETETWPSLCELVSGRLIHPSLPAKRLNAAAQRKNLV